MMCLSLITACKTRIQTASSILPGPMTQKGFLALAAGYCLSAMIHVSPVNRQYGLSLLLLLFSQSSSFASLLALAWLSNFYICYRDACMTCWHSYCRSVCRHGHTDLDPICTICCNHIQEMELELVHFKSYVLIGYCIECIPAIRAWKYSTVQAKSLRPIVNEIIHGTGATFAGDNSTSLRIFNFNWPHTWRVVSWTRCNVWSWVASQTYI